MLSGLQALAALLVLLPGLLSSTIVRAMSARKRSDFDRILEALLFSFVTYSIYIPLFGATLPISWIAANDKNGTPHYSFPIQSGRLAFIFLVAILLGLAWGFIEARDWASRFLRFLRLTRRTSSNSLWEDVLLRQKGWVQVALADGRSVIGWLAGYSDPDEERCLYLEKASLISADGQQTDVPGPGVLLTNESKIQLIMFL